MKFTKLFVFLSLIFSLSCSSDWEQCPQSDDLLINVTAPVASGSRADAPASIDGYKLVCIMQLLDESGNTVGSQSTAEMANGKFSFTVKGSDRDNGATQAIFWAGYEPVAGTGKKVYNTDDLCAVSYAVTEFDLTDKNQIAAMEVFSGVMSDLTTGSVTLKRPVAMYTFTPQGVENAKDAKTLEVTYGVTGYNVYTKGASGTQNITLKNADFDYSSTPWFVTYMLCPVDKTYSEPITVKFRDVPVVIPSDKLPLEANYQYNIKATIGKTDVSIDVSIDNSWEDGGDNYGNNSGSGDGDSGSDPVTDPGDNPGDNSGADDNQGSHNTDYQVGDMIDANGYVTTDESKAVAVYFQDNTGTEPISNYPDFSGKNIRGYAFALRNTSETVVNVQSTTISTPTTAIYGSINTNDFLLEIAGTDMAKSFEEWEKNNKINNLNFSGWYIPSYNQLETWVEVIASEGSIAALFQKNGITGNLSSGYVDYVSSNTTNPTSGSKKIRVVRLRISSLNKAVRDTDNTYYMDVSSSSKVGLCRPMVTVFKD